MDVLELTKELIAIPSVSQKNNVTISNFLQTTLQQSGFKVEHLEYIDSNNERKVSLVGKKGEGQGGLGFFSHSDTVPGQEWDWEPFTPAVQDGRLLGRGSCDMKGPLAATIIAGAAVDAAQLQRPLFIAVTADEEVGYGGAFQIASESELLQAGWPQHAIVAEPTELEPVYAHKGGCHIQVTAHGRAAHTSTDQGVSANFRIAPFLADMAALVDVFHSDERFMNHEFDPPTNGFNMIINDGGCRVNVTAAKTVCTLSLRRMPDDHIDEAVSMIEERAKQYDLEMTTPRQMGPFYTPKDAAVVQAALAATDIAQAKSVPFGTEAVVYQPHAETVVLGPGNIAQAHTVGEWIDIQQLQSAVDVYGRLIHDLCM